MSQLLMQHLNLPPNLAPSPPADRPALTRALAKRPDDRWPSVSAFVRALAAGGGAGRSGADVETPPRLGTPAVPGGGPGSQPALNLIDTPSRFAEPLGPLFTPAPPEQSGPGPLRPALIVGLGHTGLRVLQRLRFDLVERFGPRAVTPAVRTLFIDTDPDALDDAARDRPRERLAGLSADEVFGAKLNRAGHYLKPRSNGRSMTDGWFDAQLLYRLPRTPQTLGLRPFGRLAFLDHYRPLMAKVQAELEAAVAAEALAVTEARTGLKRRTNRPRVYVVGGLAGGTGGGMFLDLAYAVRGRLKRMGYDAPEVVGLFVVPPADATITPPQALANTYAALTELNHYSRPDTAFTACYDERAGFVSESDPPFARCYLVPGAATGAGPLVGAGVSPPPRRTPPTIPVAAARPRGSGAVVKPGSRATPPPAPRTPDPLAGGALKPCSDAAERLRLDLFAGLGRAADEARAGRDPAAPAGRPVTVAAFGLAAFDWPRADVVARTTVAVGRRVLTRWAAPDAKRYREVMPGLAAARWTQLGFEADAVLGHMQRAADLAAGGSVDEKIARVADPLIPRGWLGRTPEPTQVAVALDTLNDLIGPPASSIKRPLTAVEEAVAQAAAATAAGFVQDIGHLLPALTDDPQFRLAGTEELYRQFLAVTDRLIDRFTQSAADRDAVAVAGFECLTQFAHYQKGMRKPAAAELSDALRQYPRARFQALTFRRAVAVYQAVRDALSGQLADVTVARQRLAAAAAAVPDAAADDPPVPLRRLMPAGCATLGDAVERFLGVLTDADLTEIDRRVQAALEPDGGGLLRVCLNSGAGPDALLDLVFEEARAHLDERLGEVGLAAMFAERFRTPHQAERAIEQAYQEAEPAWAGAGPWVESEVAVLGCPGGPAGEPLREVARRAIPVAGLPVADTRDDLIVYREWAAVPLAALPHLGPAAAAAYHAMPDTSQCTPHARTDVTQWYGADAD
jgi:hypothetical protein